MLVVVYIQVVTEPGKFNIAIAPSRITPSASSLVLLGNLRNVVIGIRVFVSLNKSWCVVENLDQLLCSTPWFR